MRRGVVTARALRQQIRQAAGTTTRIRLALALAAPLVIGLVFLATGRSPTARLGDVERSVIVAGTIAGVLAGQAYYRKRLAQLSRQLATLPDDEQAVALRRPRRVYFWSRGQSMQPFLRDLRQGIKPSVELTPADAPGGRGDEPTPEDHASS
jgi:hypothetical protein